MSQEAGEVEVYRGGGGAVPRELIEGALREEGIAYVVKSDAAVAGYPLTVGPMGEFRVFVMQEDAAGARAALSRFTSTEPES